MKALFTALAYFRFVEPLYPWVGILWRIFRNKTEILVVFIVKINVKINICSLNSQVLGTTLEKAMAPHSSTLAWKIPWTDPLTSLSLFTFLHWRRKWQPTPVFLPGESQGRGSLAGCRLWGRTESDTTDVT